MPEWRGERRGDASSRYTSGAGKEIEETRMRCVVCFSVVCVFGCWIGVSKGGWKMMELGDRSRSGGVGKYFWICRYE